MGLLPATLLLMILGVYVVQCERKLLMSLVIVSVQFCLLSNWLTYLLLTGLLSFNGRISTQPNYNSLRGWPQS
jgi:uncharacterized membrane protein YbhN (UPF0104 family)